MIQELEQLIDTEIEQYENIVKLETEKKEILIKADSEALLNIDSQMLDVILIINNTSEKRKALCEKMNIMTSSMSEIIGYLKNVDTEAAERFEEKKVLINDYAKKIGDLERTNIELTKHGIEFANKTLDAILKGFSVTPQEYNEHGRSVSGEELKISMIEEEA